MYIIVNPTNLVFAVVVSGYGMGENSYNSKAMTESYKCVG